ncbi:Gfo/Idh/MocA family oxidoreductase [Draconibacterium sp. IB214405]|uniref:Gfo/Idh/MocA family oxidoreductase n=1 Tax=Draconibacterium sp. IB214405 TaxID=3097352 RepID=UPI002A0CCE41|nr:Gfo/Idh/MocA family oxidoreductase [Draconibacterium sp. IB214405]MDX8339331.1 Gfo/Idh/MocA family oxidoreductase [Draconibacterium sp. IB214405]
MKDQVVVALASFGMSGKVFHGPLLKVNKNFTVKLVLERSKRLSKELFPDATIVNTYDAILADNEVELVVVNTPDEFHYTMVKQALEAGKHVVVEKPATLRSAELKELIELARSKNLVFTVFQNRRWDGDFRTVQKVVEEARFGRLVEFESHYDRYRTEITPDTWKEEGDEYCGVLYNLGSHMVDQAYVLFGRPLAVTTHLKTVREGGKVADYYDIRLDYTGFSALLKCSYLVMDPGPRYMINGEYGTFKKWGIDGQEELLKAGNLPEGEDWGKEESDDWGTLVYTENDDHVEELVETIPGDYRIFYNNLYQVIRNGKELLVNPEEALEVLQILEACLLSNKERRTISI